MEPFKILVIDKEWGICESCRRILETENFQVLVACIMHGTQFDEKELLTHRGREKVFYQNE